MKTNMQMKIEMKVQRINIVASKHYSSVDSTLARYVVGRWFESQLFRLIIMTENG